MIKRIDLFMPPKSQYEVLHHFTKKMYEALARTGIACRLLEAQHDNPRPFLEDIFKDPPDCTLSFNGLLPDEEGRFFCDLIQIPHVACLVDSPNQFFLLVKSPYTIVTCPDRFACQFFKGLNCQNVLFMPHGVEKDLSPNPKVKKIYDVTALSSCIDYEAIRKSWSEHFSKPLRDTLEEAAEITLSDQETSYVQAFVQAMDQRIRSFQIDIKQLNYFDILDQLERYVRGKDRVELIKSINDAKVHIFSSIQDAEIWKKYLKNKPNIVIHQPVNFQDALKVMQESKIVLNSCPWIKNGAHERIFAALASGALAITNENIFMAEHFKDDQDIVFYQHGKWDLVNEKINDLLAHEQKREKIIKKGRELVMRHHTWDERASALLKELNPIIKKISLAEL